MNWLSEPVDLCIVIGTSGTVYPAAGYTPVIPLIHIRTVVDWCVGPNRYVQDVKNLGGKIAVVDLDVRSWGAGGGRRGLFDWVFEGDAAKV